MNALRQCLVLCTYEDKKQSKGKERILVLITGEGFESGGPTPADKCVFRFEVSCSEEIIAPNALV
jgi:hypothetical protein